jgi:hypothetical protein
MAPASATPSEHRARWVTRGVALAAVLLLLVAGYGYGHDGGRSRPHDPQAPTPAHLVSRAAHDAGRRRAGSPPPTPAPHHDAGLARDSESPAAGTPSASRSAPPPPPTGTPSPSRSAPPPPPTGTPSPSRSAPPPPPTGTPSPSRSAPPPPPTGTPSPSGRSASPSAAPPPSPPPPPAGRPRLSRVPVPEYPQWAALPPAPFPHSVVNASCPRFVRVGRYDSYAGLGHRLTNLVMTLLAAIVTNATYLHTSLDDGWTTPHLENGSTAVDAFLGLGVGEWTRERAEQAYPLAMAASHRLPVLDNNRGYNGVGPFVPNEDAARWVESVAHGGPNGGPVCGVQMVPALNVWLYDIKSGTKHILAPRFAAAMAALPAAARPPLLWDPAHLNIAVHYRKGDMEPTLEPWFAGVFNATVLPVLLDYHDLDGVPVHVHVFTERPGRCGRGVFPLLEALFGPAAPSDDERCDGNRAGGGGGAGAGGNATAPCRYVDYAFSAATATLAGLRRRRDAEPPAAAAPRSCGPLRGARLHVHDVGLQQTLYHLTHADVLLQSRSALSEMAAHMSHTTLSFAQGGNKYGPGTRFPLWTYDHCGPFNVCCDGTTGACPASGQARLLALLHRRGFTWESE